MVAPVFVAIAGAIASIGVATIVRYGFWMVISYFVYDVANDISDAYNISAKDEAERNKKADEVAKELVDDGTWDNEQYISYIDESSLAKDEEKGDIFDQIARSIGMDKKTLIWVAVGILAFSTLRG